MKSSLTRRSFLAAIPAAGPATVALSSALAETKPAKIAAIEIWQVHGHRETVRGVDQQYQVNPLYIYDELRPNPYRDAPGGTATKAPVSALYLKIRTDEGEGSYGPIDKEAAIVVDEQLQSFLMGKDALAQEKLWDQMYRGNRHSRRGHFLMAISAIDNTLWDLRGRYFKTPVYQLLGGPTRSSVEAYASCLGYSLEPEEAQARAVEVRNAGFRYQKWFLGYGPGDGYDGLKKNLELVRLLRHAVGEDTGLIFDVYSGWDLTSALEWARQVEKYRPRWEGYDYLKAGALNVVQCDPEWCGGTTELQKICALASIFDVPVIPHGHSLHAALHLIASQSPAVCPLAEYLIFKMQSYYHFEKHPPSIDKAHFSLPDAPGYGIELDDARVESRELMHWS